MNRWLKSGTLNRQMLRGLLISFAAAVCVFAVFFACFSIILDRTVYGDPFIQSVTDKAFSDLQGFVREKNIASTGLQQLNAWCSKAERIYLSIYVEGKPVFAFPETDTSTFDPELEDTEREYALTFADGTEARVFLYYFSSDFYFYLSILISALVAFGAFCVCFIRFVQGRFQYIRLLREELDILAGGDLEYPVTIQEFGELKELAEGIDQMRLSVLESQKSEAEIRKADARLMTAMSHDLRTPLTSLTTYLELADSGKYESPEQLRYFISKSLEKASRIRQMADRIFEYRHSVSSETRNGSGAAVDADPVFRNYWDDAAFSLRKKGFSVRTEFLPLSGRLSADPNQLFRVFDNLFSNLLKYADASFPVLIRFAGRDGEIEFLLENRVSPAGCSVKGTGIGLETCREIVEGTGGSMEKTEADGMFRIRLQFPLAEGPADRETS